jgi:hypothetical protein
MWTSRHYDPDFASQAVEIGRSGATREDIAAAFSASLADLEFWAREHDAFAVALADAETLARRNWQHRAVDALAGREPFQYAAWARVFTTLFGRAPLAPTRPDPKGRSGARQKGPPDVVTIVEIPDNGRRRTRTR